MNKIEYANQLLNTLDVSTSPFHTVLEAERQLVEAGFTEISMDQSWFFQRGQSYYVKPYDSTIIAFKIGSKFNYYDGFRVAASHTDFPCLMLKPVPELSEGRYLKLNVEVYGGPILNTWLDRPLSVAGRVALRSPDPFRPEVRFVDFRRPILTIPNLAIHMNREVNKGVELNRQTDMSPVVGLIEDEMNRDGFFMEALAKEMDVRVEDILSFELCVYNCDSPQIIGLNNDMISASRLDNITSVQATINALIETQRDTGINVAAAFNNEEIGSRTKQGANSVLLDSILRRIYYAFGIEQSHYAQAIASSYLASIDVAHAHHPNQSGKSDPTNKAFMGQGIVIKTSSNQAYATDCEAIAITKAICQSNSIKYSVFANRSDGSNGSTLGPILQSTIPVRTIDVGIPLLAMHSSRELMGLDDQYYLTQYVKALFS